MKARSRLLQVGISDSKTEMKPIMQMEEHQMIYSPENTKKDRESVAEGFPERERTNIVSPPLGATKAEVVNVSE